MLPSEVASKLTDLGICFQIELDEQGVAEILGGLGIIPQKEKEDFSDIGYNEESKDDSAVKEKTLKGKIITAKEDLLKYDGWHLAAKPPKELPKSFKGPRYSAYITKRRFIISGNDTPWTVDALKYTFALEYINDIKLRNNVLFIETIFGQTGITIV
jgi:hypothetical protein